MRGFIAGATTSGPRCASAASVTRLSASPWASFASVFAVNGAITYRSARVRCIEVVPRLSPASAKKVSWRTNRSPPWYQWETSWPERTNRRTSSHAL